MGENVGNPNYKRRTMRKLYDLPDGNISVVFPLFITQLKAIAEHHKASKGTVDELVSVLQGMCLAEGMRPSWERWDREVQTREFVKKKQAESAARMRDKAKQRKLEKEKLSADFPDRVKSVRDRLGDF